MLLYESKVNDTHTIQKIGVTRTVPKIVLMYVAVMWTPESHYYLPVAVH